MSTIQWQFCAGQQHIKDVFAPAIISKKVGHAYLFSGMTGSGKFAAAVDIALALLCEAPDSQPCLFCPSCQKVLNYSHPDFHIVMPVSFPKAAKDDGDDLSKEEAWEFIYSSVKERLKDLYAIQEYEKKPNIPVDWIREINHAILRGPVEGATNVVIFDGVETLSAASANSMLKVLEEPPAGTVMLLLTDRIGAVLPTLVSRCQILRFGYLSPSEIKTELCRRCSIDESDPRLESVIHTGSLGRSLYLWRHPQQEILQEALAFWGLCVHGEWTELAPVIDRIAEWNDFARYEQLFTALIDAARNAFLGELPGTENVFLGGTTRALDLAGFRSGKRESAEKIFRICQDAIGAIKAHGNITLVLTNFALLIAEELDEQKQQAG
jgi:hypothetical protein